MELKTSYASSVTVGCKGIVRVEWDTYGDDCCGPSTDVYIECPLCPFHVNSWEGDLTFHVMTEAQMMHNRLAARIVIDLRSSPVSA